MAKSKKRETGEEKTNKRLRRLEKMVEGLADKINKSTNITDDVQNCHKVNIDIDKQNNSMLDKVIKESVNLHQSLVSRWSWLTIGLSREIKMGLIDKYSHGGNIHFEALESNAEISLTLNERGMKRDQQFVAEQNLAGSALSALSQSITMVLNDEEQPLDRLDP